MKLRLKVLSGAKQGTEFVTSKNMVDIGRHPDNDFQFDPQQDIDVSTRHARMFLRDGHWHVEDLGSSNGTLVNGFAIAAATKLDDTDQIQFGGETGPNCEFRLVKDNVPDGVTGAVQATVASGAPRPTAHSGPSVTPPAAAPPAPAPAATPAGGSATQRIRIEVQKQTQGLRRLTVGLFVALVVVAAAFFFFESSRQAAREAEVAALQARTDSILAASAEYAQSLEGAMAGMQEQFQRSQTEIRRLRTSLNEANQSGDADLVATLEERLRRATTALGAQQAAAQVDFNATWEANQNATAMVYVEFGPGNVETGTGFAVRPDGTMLTNRHVVAGHDGNRTATRIGVKFANSSQVFRANLLAIGSERAADVAVIRVVLRGNVPTVQRLAPADERPRPGQPAGIIGFPLGADIGIDDEQVARPSLTVGNVSRSLDDRIQVDAWGAQGSSGSPIFDAQGSVIGILYGAETGSGGRLILAVPTSYAHELLDSVN